MGVDKYPHPGITWTSALHIDNSPHVIWDKPFLQFDLFKVARVRYSSIEACSYFNTGSVRATRG
jgi:hypothetical protein